MDVLCSECVCDHHWYDHCICVSGGGVGGTHDEKESNRFKCEVSSDSDNFILLLF